MLHGFCNFSKGNLNVCGAIEGNCLNGGIRVRVVLLWELSDYIVMQFVIFIFITVIKPYVRG